MARILLWRKHISGMAEIAVEEGGEIRMRVLPPSERLRGIRGRHNITDDEYAVIKKLGCAEGVQGYFTYGACGVPRCKNESYGIDRGVPLCEKHFDQQEQLSEKIEAQLYERGQGELDVN